MESWPARVSVTTSAVAERSGRSLAGGSHSVTTTSKSMVGVCPVPATCEGGRMALLPISVTSPGNSRSGKASRSTVALSPRVIWGTSVSSTSSTTSITVRSETVRTRLPGLFIVPTITVSPCSTFRRVTLPAMGALMTVLESWSWASSSAARAWLTPNSADSKSDCWTSRSVRAFSTSWRLTSSESRDHSDSFRSASRSVLRKLARDWATAARDCIRLARLRFTAAS